MRNHSIAIIGTILFVLSSIQSWAQTQFTQCFDFTDLYEENVVCRFCSVPNATLYPDKYDTIGVAIGNPYDWNTHISINTDPTKKCPVYLQDFYEIPEGKSSSILLGNFQSLYGFEDVEYSFTVDTTQPSILVIRYLPVLEDSHSDGAGERVSIVDEGGNVVGCLKYDIRMNESQITGDLPGNPKWIYTENGFYHHDWAALAIDLRPYHGQKLKLILQNYDCWRGAHMGFCYFHVECQDAELKADYCFPDSDIVRLSAPPGFYYRWFNPYFDLNDPNIYRNYYNLSFDQVYDLPLGYTDTIVGCELASDKDFACKTELFIKIGPRLPVARFDTIVRHGPCADTVYLYNHSFASPNGIDEYNPHRDCDSLLWDFAGGLLADGSIPDPKSSNPQPIVFTESGDYVVKLYTTLYGWDCKVDSMLDTIHVEIEEKHVEQSDTICYGMTFYVGDIPHTETGDYVDTLTAFYGCDSIVKTHLYVAPYALGDTVKEVCLQDMPIIWHNQLCTKPGYYYDTLPAAMYCDSIITLTLLVNAFCDDRDLPLNPTVDCDTVYSHTYANIKEKDLPYTWNNQTLPSVPQNPRQDTILVAPLQKFDLSCDSIATLHLHVLFPCELPTETKNVRWKK